MKTFTKTLASSLSALAGIGIFATSAQAVTIINPGFETPVGQAGFPQATGWGGEAKLALHSNFGPGSFSPGNVYFGFNNPGAAAASQTLAETFTANTTYSLNGYAVRSTSPNTDLSFQIGYNNGGFVQLAQQTYDLNPVAAWTLLDGVDYTTGSTGLELDENIIVRIRAVGAANQGAWFDEISLTATPISVVPEPSSLMLLAAAGGLLFARRRRA